MAGKPGWVMLKRFSPRIWRGMLCGGLLVGIHAVPAWAQSLPSLNDQGINPSILQPQGLPAENPAGQTLSPQDARKGSGLDTDGADAPEPEIPEESEGPRFVLREILISGVSVFPPKVLEEKFTRWIDREIGYKELLMITSDITKLYKESGYITSRAILPPQDIENGSVSIQVVEGRVGDIQIKGNEHLPDRYITARLHQKAGEVFRLQTLQKDMLNLSTDALVDKSHVTLKTGTRAGTSDLLLDVEDHFPIRFTVGTDNAGRNGLGIWRTSYTLSNDNVSGFGDSAVVSAVLASKTIAAIGQYRFPLTTNGWGIGAMYSYTHVAPGETTSDVLIDGELIRPSITGDSHRYSLFSDFPIYRTPITRRWDISGNVSLNFLDSMTYLDGHSLKDVQYELKKLNTQNTVEKFPILRTLISQVQASEQDRTGRWIMSGSMTNGIVALGGNEAYAKFNANVSRIQALPWGMIGFLRAEGQWAPDRLPFAEKMQLGGSNSVRGYQEGLLIADNGYLLSAELRYPLVFLPKDFRKNWQGLIFVDYGQLFVQGKGNPGTQGKPGNLLGYGMGIRGRLTKYLNARLDLSMAGIRTEGQPTVRAHFSLNSQLF